MNLLHSSISPSGYDKQVALNSRAQGPWGESPAYRETGNWIISGVKGEMVVTLDPHEVQAVMEKSDFIDELHDFARRVVEKDFPSLHVEGWSETPYIVGGETLGVTLKVIDWTTETDD